MTHAPRQPRLLVEMVVIIFSVLLALFLNEWRQGVARAASVDAVLETVRREAEANRDEVAAALAHHREMLAQLRTGGIVMARLHFRESGLDTTTEARFARTATELVRAQARASGQTPPPAFRARRLGGGRWQLTAGDRGAFVTIRGDSAIVQGQGGIVLRPPFLLDAAWETAQATQAAIHMDPEIVHAMARARQLQRGIEQTAGQIVARLYGMSADTDMISAISDLASYEHQLLEAYDHLLALIPG